MEINSYVSLLAQYDSACRSGFEFQGCEHEFLEFTLGQEDCQKKWLAAEKELEVIQSKLDEAKKTTSKLELLNHHVTMLLKDEVKVRSSIQEDIREYHTQFDMVRDCLSSETYLKDELIEKLNSLGPRRFPHLVNNTNARHVDKLETITEVNSAELDSVMASSERCSVSSSEPADEDLELSGTVRSYRDLHRLNKQFSELVPDGEHQTSNKRVTDGSTATEVGVLDQCIVATTTVSFSMQTGSTVVSSVIEGYPGSSSSDECTHNTTVIRKHRLKRQVVIHQIETCYPCGLRIKFGKSALKCIDCGMNCHIDCESLLPRSCDPQTSKNETEKRLEVATPKK
ncbi:hypothetical protein DAPPUDRAFT_96691 [Daphnia pulex]|uniref:Phorbol-ester/DAG-type domain-containing protein n=1 Tax=Daphnia pulex TaxID=6669 RepID=E9FYM1_DAPPU|nr:hypothetical protein DAPPUDRAFT_96691 [Daphnia pulex]|eukprot:EFX87554.1 hypothetical protein DAPPUDRAFT_96691 [Daphnia pulex]